MGEQEPGIIPSLHTGIVEVVATLPNEESRLNPYRSRVSSTKVRTNSGDMTKHYTPDGAIEFGGAYEVCRVMQGDDMELIFAAAPEPTHSAFVVHKFNFGGGLASRTTFNEAPNGYWQKSWQSRGFVPVQKLRDAHSREYSRYLSVCDIEALNVLLRSLVYGGVVRPEMDAVITPDQFEKRLIEKNAMDMDRRRDGLSRDVTRLKRVNSRLKVRK